MTAIQEHKAIRKWAKQIVFVSEPHIHSAAALVLLSRQYLKLDKTVYTTSRMDKVRRKWIRKLMQTPDEKGGLTCQICGRKGLKPKCKNRRNLATLDHVVELSKGGQWDNPNNFQVACYVCNSHRSNSKITT